MVHASGTAVGYATYLGGADDDASWDVAIDSGGGAYITGVTNSTNFPLAGTPVQGIYGGSSDGYVARISNPSATPTATQTATATSTAIATDTPAPTGTATDTPAPTSTATTITTPTATSTPTQTSTPTTTPVLTVCTTQFNDVGVEHPFYPYIRCLACQGIISGYTCGAVGEPCPGNYFRPYAFITRGQAAKIIAISAGITETIPSTQQTFEDVPPGHPFWLPIEQLAEQGMINGYDCGGPGEPCDTQHRPYFRAQNNVTRGQFSKIVANAAGYSETPTTQTFEDVPPGHPFYLWIERIARRNIISGYTCGAPPAGGCVAPGNRPYFLPGNWITRGQATKIDRNAFFPNCQGALDR
jgi:hypothetical protein